MPAQLSSWWSLVDNKQKEYFDQLNDKDQKILIPGCGNAYEAEYLYQNGFKNIFLVDFSKKALDNFKKRIKNFPKENLICKDFFDVDGTYDLIIEQTFFCAISKKLRPVYAKKVHSLLSKNGKLVGLLFNAPMYEDHPPFGGTKDEYSSYFNPFFNFKIFDTINWTCSFVAEPLPHNDCFTFLGANWYISIADFAPANIIADLDWPKVTADLTFLL